ncbi:MAG: von Willebrand factor type A domain-containing protein, partial [Planctomycetota bacterium]
LLGVGVLVISKPPVAVGTAADMAGLDAEQREALFEEAQADRSRRAEVLKFSGDAATVPSTIEGAEAALEKLHSMGYLGAPEEEVVAAAPPQPSTADEGAAPPALGKAEALQLQGLGYGAADSEEVSNTRAKLRRSREARGRSSKSAVTKKGAAGPAAAGPASGPAPSSSSSQPSDRPFDSDNANSNAVLRLGRGMNEDKRAKAGVELKEIDIPQADTLTFDFGLEAGRKVRSQVSLERRPGESPRDMFFRFWGDNPFVVTRNDALSTFAADVDTASFALARRMLREGRLPQRAQIRTEEFVNFLRPDLPTPEPGYGNDFAVHGELAPSPFGGREDRWLLRVGLRARDIERSERPPLALTFVVDTSGSMRTDNRLELVKHAMRLLVDQLDDRDSLAIVGFSNEAVEVLPPTPASARDVIETALFGLQPEGGTNAEAGIKLGYSLSLSSDLVGSDAQRRVVFLSDGVANIGQTDQDRLAADVSGHAAQGVFLNTIGVGMTNHNDVFLEQLADKGQGVCDYVGDAKDARRAIVERFISGFFTVAKDVKIQVEFDGEKVLRWRQLGYENRAVADRDFRSDAVDAGEIGAGHQVSCFYEIELASGATVGEALLAKVRLRYRPTNAIVLGARTTETEEREADLSYGAIAAPSFRGASAGFRLGALSAQFAEFLRRSYHTRGDSLERLSKGLANLLVDAPSEDAATIAEAFRQARALGLKALPAPRPTDDDAAAQAAYYEALIESLGGADPAVNSAGAEGATGHQNETAPGAEKRAEKPSEKAPTAAQYESRIRELLDGDRGKGPH